MKAVLLAPLVVLMGLSGARGDEPPKPDEPVRTFLTKHCHECHSGAKPKGAFGVTNLASDFAETANRDRWLAVLEARTGR